jgi:hypothetical protein
MHFANTVMELGFLSRKAAPAFGAVLADKRAPKTARKIQDRLSAARAPDLHGIYRDGYAKRKNE